MTVHSFTVADAQLYGVEKATILYNLRFWLDKNKANDKNIKDGYVWTYNSSAAFHKLFPYLSPQKIARLLRDLESSGVIMSANYNKAGFDKTKWYTIVQEYSLDCSNMNNALFNSEQPIPDSKPDKKPDHMSSGNDPAQDVLDIYHHIIGEQNTNWAKAQVFDAQRKNLCRKAYALCAKRAKEIGMRPLDVLANLLRAMAQDDFYSGRPNKINVNGYRCTIDQTLNTSRLKQAIDKLGGQE